MELASPTQALIQPPQHARGRAPTGDSNHPPAPPVLQVITPIFSRWKRPGASHKGRKQCSSPAATAAAGMRAGRGCSMRCSAATGSAARALRPCPPGARCAGTRTRRASGERQRRCPPPAHTPAAPDATLPRALCSIACERGLRQTPAYATCRRKMSGQPSGWLVSASGAGRCTGSSHAWQGCQNGQLRR